MITGAINVKATAVASMWLRMLIKIKLNNTTINKIKYLHWNGNDDI